jgi:hypothetical protein
MHPGAGAGALSKIDQAIAADADALLQGDFETIDAVLEGVFEEQAALVQMNDKSPAANPRAFASSRVATAVTKPAVEQPPKPPEQVDAAPAEQTPALDAAQSDERAAEPALAAEAVEPATATCNEVAMTVADAAVAAIEASNSAPSDADLAPQPPMPLPQVHGGGRGRGRGLMSMGKNAAVAMLMAINYPLRFVPAAQRPIIDWVALSLLGWVPIVWVLALTLGHKNAHVQASPEVHQAGSVLATTAVEDKAMQQAAPDTRAEQGDVEKPAGGMVREDQH